DEVAGDDVPLRADAGDVDTDEGVGGYDVAFGRVRGSAPVGADEVVVGPTGDVNTLAPVAEGGGAGGVRPDVIPLDPVAAGTAGVELHADGPDATGDHVPRALMAAADGVVRAGDVHTLEAVAEGGGAGGVGPDVVP